MFCRNCGNELPSGLVVACMKCGCNPNDGNSYCPNCGASTSAKQIICVKCGTGLTMQTQTNPYPGADYSQSNGYNAPKQIVDKSTAGLLAILLGGFGIHQFYMGNTKSGILHLVITFVTCGFGSIIALIEGIKYLSMTDEEFNYTYVQNKKDWF